MLYNKSKTNKTTLDSRYHYDVSVCVSQVRQDILNCGLMPKDIRLIRKKDTGNYHQARKKTERTNESSLFLFSYDLCYYPLVTHVYVKSNINEFVCTAKFFFKFIFRMIKHR